MKKPLILLLLLVFSILLYAQDGVFLSKIKLTDGSELNVVILENVPGKYVKIRLPGNSEATIDYSNIVSIKHQNYSYKPEFALSPGWHFTGSFGVLFGRATTDGSVRSGTAISGTANYRLKPFLSVGIGIEPTILFVNDGYLLLPTFVRLGGSFSEKKVVPIYFIDAGWSFAKSNSGQGEFINAEGGYFVRPGIGLRFNKLLFTLGYQVQKVTTTSEFNSWWNGSNQLTTEVRTMKNMMLSIGYNF